MANFQLTVVTPSSNFYNDKVDKLIVRTTTGDIGVLSGHISYVAPLAIGSIEIINGSTRKKAAIAGGMIKIGKDNTTILTDSCEWVDEIDVDRAKKAAERAKAYKDKPTELHTEEVAEIKLQRALNRINLGSKK